MIIKRSTTQNLSHTSTPPKALNNLETPSCYKQDKAAHTCVTTQLTATLYSWDIQELSAGSAADLGCAKILSPTNDVFVSFYAAPVNTKGSVCDRRSLRIFGP